MIPARTLSRLRLAVMAWNPERYPDSPWAMKVDRIVRSLAHEAGIGEPWEAVSMALPEIRRACLDYVAARGADIAHELARGLTETERHYYRGEERRYEGLCVAVEAACDGLERDVGRRGAYHDDSHTAGPFRAARDSGQRVEFGDPGEGTEP